MTQAPQATTDTRYGFFFEPTPEGGLPAKLEPLTTEAMRKLPIVLIRSHDGEEEQFEVATQLGFHHPSTGISVVVPGPCHPLHSDLTSTPDFFAWLIPKTGVYLPAALVHDGLVVREGEARTHWATRPVDRRTADWIFRDAMAVLGVRVPRRWLIWTAVTVATAFTGELVTNDGKWRKGKRTWQAIVVATLGSVAVLGTIATVDLFRDNLLLWWMRVDSLGVRILAGAAGAAVVPSALAAILWSPVRRAGIIAGVALAFLLHVTAVILALTVGFRLLDDRKALWRDTVKLWNKLRRPRATPDPAPTPTSPASGAPANP